VTLRSNRASRAVFAQFANYPDRRRVLSAGDGRIREMNGSPHPQDDGAQVWLVRHGETEWSRDGRHTSVTDLPLTEAGVEVARELRAKLAGPDFGLVLTSPRVRARHTAELAGFPDVEIDEDLVEWGYGDYEGITSAEIRERVPGWTIWTHPTPGGEAATQVTTRLDRVVARCKKAMDSEQQTGQLRPVLLFGHGHALRALAARWIEQPVEEGKFFRLDTATVSVLGYERETPVILRWNA
jgi:probable phosphoglycerate mutase